MRIRLLPPDSELGWTPYGWLVYLVFFFVFLAIGRQAWWVWPISIASVLVFLPLYFRGFWLSGPRLFPIVAAIAALGVGLMPIYPGGAIFFVYSAGFLGGVGRPSVGFRSLAVVVGVLAMEAWLVRLPIGAWLPVASIATLVGGSNIHFGEASRTRKKLRLAQDEVERLAKVAERERIARDLHDLLGHTLSVIVLKSELASKLADRDLPRAIQEIRDVERISRDALVEVRKAVQGYRSRGLREELDSARLALQTAGVALECEIAPLKLAPREESVLALALRESVTNVIRHARATRCRVRVYESEGQVSLEVSDDGVGGERREGAGLLGMRTRVRELAGTFEWDGQNGTRVAISLPIAAANTRGLVTSS